MTTPSSPPETPATPTDWPLDSAPSWPQRLLGVLRRHPTETGLLLAIVLVLAATCLVSRDYLARPGYHASEILRQTAVLGIFALGAGVVIIAGGIDLSSGSVIAFSGAVCAALLFWMSPVVDAARDTGQLSPATIAAGIAGTLAVAFLIGSFHAWLVTTVGLPPFVATLGSLVGLRSLARLLVQDVNAALKNAADSQIYIYDADFRALGQQWWVPLLVFFVLLAGFWVLLNFTVVGRHLYAMGGNELAARLSGIRTERLKWLAYCLGTLTAATAGILYVGYSGGSYPENQGLGYELHAIAAAVIGGCSLQGGVGSVLGIALGALFLRVVTDAVNKVMQTKPDDFLGLIVGILVVLAVSVNELRAGRGTRKAFFPGALGWVAIVNLTLLTGVITSVIALRNKVVTGAIAGGLVLLLLGVKKFLELGPPRTHRAA
jgi:ribose/xylose/arabinose/galactoside ABC-type transport system permease subunit